MSDCGADRPTYTRVVLRPCFYQSNLYVDMTPYLRPIADWSLARLIYLARESYRNGVW
jgi:hypothetical protein